uniref:glycosyltransferase n=1 Tax=Nocardia farcinica TaxID=37329 RepID=UPI00245887C1
MAVAATRLGTGLAMTGCVIALLNRLTAPRLSPGLAVLEPVTVCVPARDEAARIGELVADLRGQVGVPRLRVFVLDDGSTDGTAEVARAAAPRVKRGAQALGGESPYLGLGVEENEANVGLAGGGMM